ncbi:MAG: phosphodiester glycosidase family protein [Firmicutes bacterium]|nr:phosphodiester glycosidase family protein [Bacillota bacterium]
MKPAVKRKIAVLTCLGLTVIYSVYVLLDTFLLSSVQKSAQEDNLTVFANLSADIITDEDTSSDTSDMTTLSSEDTEDYVYSDDHVKISLTQYREYDTDIYVADVWLSSAEYLKTALAQGSYGKNITQKTSEMAEDNNAILAINGDYYGARESGYVIRNGVIYRDYGNEDTDILCIYADGHFSITNSAEKTTEELIEEGVWQAFSFGPGLIEEGEITVSPGEEVGKAKSSNPRTAVGQIEEASGSLHYVFVVSDGRTDESAGLSLSQLAEFLQSLGVTTAYNLDGGGSSTMVLLGEIINNPTTSGKGSKERSVSDIVYITAG